MDRRFFVQSTALLSGSGLAACASTATGAAVKTPFEVAPVLLPIAGSDAAFPVAQTGHLSQGAI